ncbi:unnamed protein product [Microthlaspi erraticum]|uniref:Uncharacterized protein n=1 Tax=Microthlaspi erraticum TaxID=1685480 RepID=A0A6D2IEQ3_9BRAS|nr:unnamed protein product [Microthlaspi erraticum]
MAFPCHLLNFWRSPILLWQPQQRGSSLEPHTPQSNSTQAHPNPHSPGPDLQLDPQLRSSARDSARSSSGSSSRKSSSCPTNVYTGGLKSMFSPLTTVVSSGLGRRTWRSNQWMCELELEPPIQLLVLNEKVGLAKLDVHPTWFSGSPISWVHSSSTQDRCDEPSNT